MFGMGVLSSGLSGVSEVCTNQTTLSLLFTSSRSVVQLVDNIVGFLPQDQFILHEFDFEERVLTCCLLKRDKGPWTRVFLLGTVVQSLGENSACLCEICGKKCRCE